MRFIQVDISLPKLHVREAEVSGQQGVLHAIVLADVKDSVPMLQQAGGLQASVVLRVGELGGWGALCRCWPGFQTLLFLLLLLSRKRLALARALAVEIGYNDGRRGGEHRLARWVLLAGLRGAAVAAAGLLRCRRRRGPWGGCWCLGLHFSEGHRPLLLRAGFGFGLDAAPCG